MGGAGSVERKQTERFQYHEPLPATEKLFFSEVEGKLKSSCEEHAGADGYQLYHTIMRPARENADESVAHGSGGEPLPPPQLRGIVAFAHVG